MELSVRIMGGHSTGLNYLVYVDIELPRQEQIKVRP